MPLPSLLVRLAPAAGRGYLRLVGMTTRYRYENREALERARAFRGPVLLALWHNRLLGPIFPGRGQGMGVVISRSRDGEIASRLVEGFGFKALRGSSSRGGASVLRAVLRHVGEGLDVAFTPDGPRGPRYEVQLGAAYAARKTGLPVLPLGVGMSRKKVFSSWDRFQLPVPFGVIQLVFGEPLLPVSGEDDGAAAQRIRRALLEATDRADRLLGVSSP